jgi:hypothetical protein
LAATIGAARLTSGADDADARATTAAAAAAGHRRRTDDAANRGTAAFAVPATATVCPQRCGRAACCLIIGVELCVPLSVCANDENDHKRGGGGSVSLCLSFSRRAVRLFLSFSRCQIDGRSKDWARVRCLGVSAEVEDAFFGEDEAGE